MASIFDAYAQAYDKSLRTENAMAENLRRAYIDKQTMDINQANAARQAQRFNFELQNLQAETPNKVAQANIMNSIINDPAFVDAVRTGKISGAQVTALMNNASLTGLQGMGNDLPTALSAGLFQNLNAANQSQRQIALGGNDPAEVARLFGVKNPRKEGGFWLDDAGKKIYSSPAAGLQANMWEDYMNKLRGGTSTSGTTPMASMAPSAQRPLLSGVTPSDAGAGRGFAIPPIQPIQPLLPTPAVAASPAMPATPKAGGIFTNQPSITPSKEIYDQELMMMGSGQLNQFSPAAKAYADMLRQQRISRDQDMLRMMQQQELERARSLVYRPQIMQ